ncbi:MAG: hypothetical protein WCL06_16120, partial [Bacteroidota bacterium]
VFNSCYNPEFRGDFDKDGNTEIIFSIDQTGGGTAVWQVIYCLKEKNDGSLQLILLNYPCACSKPYHCQASPHPELISVVKNDLIIRLACLANNDNECCPSQYYQITYKYKNDSLIKISCKEVN